MGYHTFSIGLRSGLSAAVFHHLIPFLLKYFCANLLLCFGSSSCWKRCVMAKLFSNGSKPLFKICVHLGAFIIPVNKTNRNVPCFEMALHTRILTGCLSLLFSFHDSFHLRKVILPCLSSATVNSSLNITLSKSSLFIIHCMHHLSGFRLLPSRIS